MIIIKKKLNVTCDVFNRWLPDTPTEEILLLDIETTGFSSKTEIIYLIGCIYKKMNETFFIQWLCEDSYDEVHMLKDFATFVEPFSHLIHYNGKMFDVPFIKNRMLLHHIQNTLEEKIELDVYLEVKKFNRFLPLENLKLKTLEAYFDFNRKDMYDGGTLIKTFETYTMTRDTVLRSLLLLHNEEDLIGTLISLRVIDWLVFIKSIHTLAPSSIEQSDSHIHVHIPCQPPYENQYQRDDYKMVISSDKVVLSFPIHHDELKFHFDDYKHYYYLPSEDTAIHESVAHFVDSSHRKKATKQTAYIKKRGTFVPLLKNHHTDYKTFKKNLSDSIRYVELTETLFNDKAFFKECLEAFVVGL